jgi:DNA-binding transcriptional LysR family regulator
VVDARKIAQDRGGLGQHEAAVDEHGNQTIGIELGEGRSVVLAFHQGNLAHRDVDAFMRAQREHGAGRGGDRIYVQLHERLLLAGCDSRFLDTSAATVLRRLRVLEKTLNTSLFSRGPRGYALTPTGHELLEHALAIESELLAAERRVGGRDQSLTGTIRVSTLDDLVQTVLGRIIADLARRHPAVCLDLIIESEYTNLARRLAHVAIRAGSDPGANDVIAKRVCTIGIALCASREYLRRHRTPVCLEDLSRHRIARAGLPMEKLLDRHVPATAAVVRSNSMLARVAAVRDGVGVGMLPCFIADGERGLVRVGDVVTEASAALWFLVHPDLRRNARVRAFVGYAHEELLRLKDRLAGEA